MSVDPILVWSFDDAPKEFSLLSDHGGDEDWLCVVPAGWNSDGGPPTVTWADSGTPFGRCEVSFHKLPDGRWVLIGAHA